MKKAVALMLAVPLLLILSGCAVHLHFDLLGEDTLQEVVLQKTEARDKILLLDIEGILVSGNDTGSLSRERNLLSSFTAKLERAAQDPDIRAVILRLDTPGGEVTASDLLHHEILRFKKRTGLPVTALMMSLAASGGYYVACACDRIIALPTTLTGSIGVIALFPDTGELLGNLGLRVNVIKSGALKDAGSLFRGMTDQERALFQGMIDEDYRTFVDVVTANRSGRLTREEVIRLADGRVYTARQALEAKLIDEIGYFDSALSAVLKMAGLPRAKVVAYTYYPKTRTNIYSLSPAGRPTAEEQVWSRLLAGLKSGFYYLWLPQASAQ
ncbi:MAG: signal peptide peptidase SppA [Candidatus Aminicenantales bacterium]